MKKKYKWEWNWKAGMLVVIPCILASMVADLINKKDVISIAVNAIAAFVGSSFGVFLLWLLQRRKRMQT